MGFMIGINLLFKLMYFIEELYLIIKIKNKKEEYKEVLVNC